MCNLEDACATYRHFSAWGQGAWTSSWPAPQAHLHFSSSQPGLHIIIPEDFCDISGPRRRHVLKLAAGLQRAAQGWGGLGQASPSPAASPAPGPRALCSLRGVWLLARPVHPSGGAESPPLLFSDGSYLCIFIGHRAPDLEDWNETFARLYNSYNGSHAPTFPCKRTCLCA